MKGDRGFHLCPALCWALESDIPSGHLEPQMQSQNPMGTKEQTQVDEGSFMLRELRKNKGLGIPASCLLEEAGLWDLAEERGGKVPRW